MALHKPTGRIISLAPSLTEMLFSAGAGSQIKGVIAGSDYPQQAKNIPQIASYNHLNVETILSLKPTLIITWDQARFGHDLQILHSFAIPILSTHQDQLSDVPRLLKQLGELADTANIADQAAANFSRQLHALMKEARVKKLRVFYELWSKPLITISKHSEINQMIEMCGGMNIFRDAHGSAPMVSLEAVLLANPEVIFSSQSLEFWQQWPELAAVRNHQLYHINPDWIERPGMRNLLAIAQICQELKEAKTC